MTGTTIAALNGDHPAQGAMTEAIGGALGGLASGGSSHIMTNSSRFGSSGQLAGKGIGASAAIGKTAGTFGGAITDAFQGPADER